MISVEVSNGGDEISVSEPRLIGRVASRSPDGHRIWIELAGGSVATADSAESEFELEVGAIVAIHAGENSIEEAPVELFQPTSDSSSGGSWVGVVKLIRDELTVIEVGAGGWRPVPTSDVEYELGYTVEGTDGVGVRAVLDEKPLKWLDRDEGEIVLDRFRPEPDGSMTFEDFGGLPDVVGRARELIETTLERRTELDQVGANPVKGILFTGLPGTGKTMLARVIAHNAGAEFYEISGPTIFSKWFSESEELLRQIFQDAEQNSPSIIFFDEIDSVAGQRNEEAHEASKRVVAQLLTLMDGFKSNSSVIVIAATNRPEDIDVALRRPGRFDWQIDFPLPSPADRMAMLLVHERKHSSDGQLPHSWVVEHSAGWSAAELAAIWNESGLIAVADRRVAISGEDYLNGFERVAKQRAVVQSSGGMSR